MEAVRLLGLEKKTRIYQASTSELYGLVQEDATSEKTPFYPVSMPWQNFTPIGSWSITAKPIIFSCNGILFNHESPLRGGTFVTRKIARAVAAIATGRQETLFLGNLNAERDWGHAKDYVEAMWLIMQQDEPEDFVIATGITTPVREFVKMAFAEVGIEIHFKGEGVDETGTVAACNNPSYQLPIGREIVSC